MKKLIEYFVILFLVVINTSCEKDRDYRIDFQSVVVSSASELTVINGKFDTETDLESKGLLFSVDTFMTVLSEYKATDNFQFSHDGKVFLQGDENEVTFKLEKLLPGRLYYYKLFSLADGVLKYSEVKTFLTTCPGLGCGPAGGRIIYLDGNGGGIEMATSFQTEASFWGCSSTKLGSTFEFVGSGATNTKEILINCEPGTLAEKCYNYTQNGFSGYYMPSVDELALIFLNVYGQEGDLNDWQSVEFASSTEYSTGFYYSFNFETNSQIIRSKQSLNNVTIPVRSF